MLSTRSRYGLKAMFDLAMNYGSRPVSLKSVAERQKLPEQYLEQIVIGLRKANLVKGLRGAQGGYVLTRPPAEISVGDIIRAVETDLTPTDCLADPDAAGCEQVNFCPSRSVWIKIGNSINDAMDAISLEDMIHDYKGMCPSISSARN
jgi:Rrf2 family cysteine metabolism transcriptional repressor